MCILSSLAGVAENPSYTDTDSAGRWRILHQKNKRRLSATGELPISARQISSISGTYLCVCRTESNRKWDWAVVLIYACADGETGR